MQDRVTVGPTSDPVPPLTLTIDDAEKYGALWLARAATARRHNESQLTYD